MLKLTITLFPAALIASLNFFVGLEFVNMAAEAGVLLFNMNNHVLVEEQLMAVGLKTDDKSTH